MKTKVTTKKRRTPVTATVFPRMADLDKITLGHGGHRPPGAKTPKELCVMEAFAFVRGIAHTDHPPCVSDKIGSFMRSWNDSIPDTPEGRATRDRLLKPLIPLMVDTATGPADDLRRSYMALDWFVRVHLPAWLDLSEKCRPAAVRLRALPELTDPGTLALASPLIQAASVDAAAAGAAAWDAARAAAARAPHVRGWEGEAMSHRHPDKPCSKLGCPGTMELENEPGFGPAYYCCDCGTLEEIEPIELPDTVEEMTEQPEPFDPWTGPMPERSQR